RRARRALAGRGPRPPRRTTLSRWASMTTTYHVSGLTCQHCVNAVTEESSALEGVRPVSGDLVEGGTSPVRVETDRQLDRAAVATAIDEAGYELADAS